MSVRVLTTVQTHIRETEHPDAVAWSARANAEFETGGAALVLLDSNGQKVATYAPGCWASVEKLPEPEPVNATTPLANAATEPKARTWSSEVEAVANKVSIDIAHALHEGIADPQVRDLAASMVVVGHDLGVSFGRLDAAFRRIPRRDAEPESATPEPPAGTPVDADPNRVLTSTAEAVLSETSEPFVSVNLSVTSDNSAEVVKVIRKLVREGRLCAGALA